MAGIRALKQVPPVQTPDSALVHTDVLLDSLLDLFESGSRSDLTLRVQTPDRDQVEILQEVRRPGAERESRRPSGFFGKFIRYLYSGELPLLQQEALPLHALACRFNVSSLRRGLSDHMTRSLQSDWPGALVTSWLDYAVQMGEAWLRELCLRALALTSSPSSWAGDSPASVQTWSWLWSRGQTWSWTRSWTCSYGVQTWIQTNEPDGLTAESVLRGVRYAMIPPQDLFQIQTQSSVLQRFHESVRDLLLLSFQFHSGSPLTMSRFWFSF
ncbi:hypothetical protein WMY93_033982 [Mugilogobius chulae]|uniref:BTB domain-containing protein n=1 Tax=Mugilogobius chulae TaxID=88201 RepID=A0AAW0MR08_9GOBI